MAGFSKCLVFGSDATTQNYFPFEARDRTGFRWVTWIGGMFAAFARLPIVSCLKKYTVDCFIATFGLKGIDGKFVLYLFILAVFHWSTSRWLSESENWLTSAPAMVILLVWIAFMAIAGIANAMDRYRVPVAAVVLLFLTVWLSSSGSTRDIRTVNDGSRNQFVAKVGSISADETDFLKSNIAGSPEHVEFIGKQTADLEDAAWNAIVQRMERLPDNSDKGRTIVVVTCPGGGIHAAAWSACVLDGLCNDYVEFKDSIGTISGVSGGSVGTLMFVSSRYDSELQDRLLMGAAMPSTEVIHGTLKKSSPALDLAARSSLEQIAYGITTDDLYGSISPSLSVSGRGQRLEDSFSMRLPARQQELTMDDWGDRAIDGTVPIVVFNSSDTVTGRRVLFDTIPTPRRASSVGQTSRPLNYRELLKVVKTDEGTTAKDVKPATAARTSATFPYISPFTKPDDASPRGEAVAICDGGYVDNEGIVSAVNWIEFMLKRWAALPPKQRPFDRILLLRIEPAPTKDLNEVPDAGGWFGRLRWIFGPAETMVKVRSASQLERGNLESDLAALYLQLNTEESTEAQKLAFAQERSGLLLGAVGKQGESDDKARVQGAFRPTPNEEIADEPTSDFGNLPVVVETIRFKNEDRVVPLNWKLSKKQKQWYIDSWEKCRSEKNTLNSTLERLFTPIN